MVLEHAEHWSYEADGDALRKFQSLSPEQRVESLFMAQLAVIRKVDGTNTRLDILNGQVSKTKLALAEHIHEHDSDKNDLAFLKRWGARGTAFLTTVVAIAASAVIIFDRLGG